MDEKLGLKEMLLVAPAVGTVLAFTFEVGNFVGIDRTWFSVFSLSEHISFALDALPVALTVGVAVVAFLAIRESRAAPLFSKEWTSRIVTIVALLGIGGLLAVGAGLLFEPTRNLAYGFLYCFFTLFFFLAFYRFVQTPLLRIAFIAISSLLLTFAFGVLTGWTDMRREPKRPSTVQLDGSEMRGLVLRAGERGVLFRESGAKTIHLLKWDSIKKLSRQF